MILNFACLKICMWYFSKWKKLRLIASISLISVQNYQMPEKQPVGKIVKNNMYGHRNQRKENRDNKSVSGTIAQKQNIC